MKIAKKKFIKILPFLIPLMLVSGCNKSNQQISSVEELKNGSFVFGAPSLTYCHEQAPKEFPNAKEIRAFSDMTSAYLALQQGKIDCLIQDETMARVEISNGVDGVKILDDKLDINANIAVGISNNSTIANELSINSALDEFINDGIIEMMENRWIKEANYSMPEIDMPSGSLPTLKVATAGNVEPFSFYKNGDITGFDVELSKRLAVKLNCKVDFEINPDFTSLISSTQSGKTDILISNLYVTEERRQQMPLSIPYRTTYGVAVVRDYSQLGYTSLEELKHKKIGYDSTSTQFENQLNKYLPECNRALYNSTADCVAALQSNRIDGFITDLPNAKYVCQINEGFKLLPEYLDKDDYGFILEKNSPLTSKFNEIIQKYKTTNVLKELEEKWFSDLEHPNKPIHQQDPNRIYEKTIRVGTTAVVPPMTYLDANNQVIGFEADLLCMIGDELDIKVVFQDPANNIGGVIASLATGQIDVGFNSMSITEERCEQFDMTITHYEGAAVIVVRNGVVSNKGFFEKIGNSFRKTFVVEQRWKMILEGMLMTLIISVFSGIIGLLLGFGICMLRKSKNKPLNKVLAAIVKVIQGTPVVVFLMIMYYVIFGKIDISAVVVAILAFGINFGIYGSEIMRSGFESVDIGQEEAARAMGYSKVQTFFKITFPQAAKKFIPVLRGEFISMVKMTSIAGYISVTELTRVGDVIRSKTMEAFFPLIVIALIYFALAELLTFGLSKLEKNLDSRNKPFKLKGGKKDGK